MNDELVDDFVEIELDQYDDFLKVKETLTRIGVASRKDNTLYQSCHILHKRNRYYITHFKELFLLDGKDSDFGEDDVGRRNTIINLLEEWGLVTIIDKSQTQDPISPLSNIKVISFRDKSKWKLEPKYSIGKQ